MTSTALDELPLLDLFDPAVAADPYAAARELSHETWIARTPTGLAILRWEESKLLARDKRFRTPPGLGLAAFGITEGFAYDWANGVLLGLDGEDHARIRAIATAGLSRRYLEGMRPHARALIAEIAEGVQADGRADVAAILMGYSVRMICRLMGFPESDWPRLAAWSDAAVQLPTTAVLDQFDRITEALLELRAYTTEHVARMDGDGTAEGFLVELLAAERDGRISRQEILELCEALLMAGAETTKTMIAFGLMLFAKHPDQWRALREDPSLVEQAVEEVLRYRIPQLGVGRVPREDVTIQGVDIPAGTFCLVAVPSANFDELAYDAPEAFDIHRFSNGSRCPAQGHLTFGSGIHVCIGAHLARLELQEGLAHLAQVWPDLRLDDEDPQGIVWNSPFGVHGPARLPLRWDAP